MKGVIVDLDRTVKEPGKPLKEEVFDTMYQTMQRTVFGFATGRSIPSIQRIITEPYQNYLASRNLNVDPKRLFIAGNNGAFAFAGFKPADKLYERPLDIQEVLRLPETTILSRITHAYVGTPFTLEGMNGMDSFDDYCFYLEHPRVSEILMQLGINESHELLVRRINTEIQHANISIRTQNLANNSDNKPFELRALANTDGIDIVNRQVSKATAYEAYRAHTSSTLGVPVEKGQILAIGDSPDGNDRELTTRPGGVSDITRHGPQAVLEFIKQTVLNGYEKF